MSLNAVIEAVAALPLVFNSQPVPVLSGASLPAAPPSAQLPARLLPGIDDVTIMALTGGASARVLAAYTLRDLFLYKPLTQGGGVDEFTQALRAYADAYIDAARDAIGLIRPRVVVERVTLRIGTIAYPTAGRIVYAGVSAGWHIREARP